MNGKNNFAGIAPSYRSFREQIIRTGPTQSRNVLYRGGEKIALRQKIDYA
ncbi:hypothetical protein KTT_57640 [Tengunoibacter tsumagoiensis]|uniref:Uncharacterized protein n=1 Tax=Tengunoibacter tsumagoiensis TaxID=2014871 RepID=A0A402AAC7_9CHLR|nr:hypothetical protein KTT_57640 [Tengunoibacter tsumagoiensis]